MSLRVSHSYLQTSRMYLYDNEFPQSRLIKHFTTFVSDGHVMTTRSQCACKILKRFQTHTQCLAHSQVTLACVCVCVC